MENTKDLNRFLSPFPLTVRQTTKWLREFVWELYPESNELIYDNYNALVFAFSLSDHAGDAFCSIAVYSKYVNFGFNRGTEIKDPQKKLNGGGNLYRSLRVEKIDDFPTTYVKQLLNAAYSNALSRQSEKSKPIKGKTLTKSISLKKRRPG